MKKITKQDPPQSFRSWRYEGDADWNPSWGALALAPKNALHVSLLQEQGYICCYCGMGITHETSHIEHLIPQSKAKELSLDYDNLLASCLRQPVSNQPRHCGVLKGNWYDPLMMISPLNDDCEHRFSFDASGAVSPNNRKDKGAKTTISRLGLNIDKLTAFRRKAIEGYLEILDSMNSSDIQRLIASSEHRSSKGSFVPFCFAIAQVLKTLV